MRRAAIAIVLASTAARADDRLAQPLIPDLEILEPIYHLDRYEEHGDRSLEGAHGTGGLAVGSDVETLVAGAAGWRDKESYLATMRGEVATSNLGILRGHYRAIADAQDEKVGVAIGGTAGVMFGEAMMLAPAPLGGGRRTAADAAADAALRLGKHEGDFVFAGELHADGGFTYWDTAPVDHAQHRALGFGIGAKTFDGEIPRGTIDLTRTRVEQVTISRPVLAAGGRNGDTQVRVVELGAGTTALTLHIDHELLAVIATDLGWSWLESVHDGMRSTNDAFRMRLGSAVEAVDEDREVRRVGFSIGRIPTYTTDGRLASEWRHELELGRQTDRWLMRARGGISWLTPLEGSARPTTTRYGSQFEVYLRIVEYWEVGGFYAVAYEPPGATDPWATPRRWHSEAGMVFRARF